LDNFKFSERIEYCLRDQHLLSTARYIEQSDVKTNMSQ
jgi:hypothetical protein